MLKISYPNSEVGKVLSASSSAVWNFITDATRWTQWGPSVVDVDCKERFIRQGSRGRVKLPFGIWLPFVITDYKDQSYWSWRVLGIQATGHRIEPLGQDRCMLIFEVPTIASIYLLICWIALKKIARILNHE